MLTENNGEISQVRASAFGTLLHVVVLQQVEKLEDFKDRFRRFGCINLPKEKITEEWPSWYSRWVVAQTFTAMALEAFYFDYIQANASPTQAKKKRTPPERFSYICNDLLGVDQVDTKSCLCKLEKLNMTRNHWVHNKSATFEEYEKVKAFFSPDECISLIVNVLSIIADNDPDCILARETLIVLTQVQSNVDMALNELTT
ncbi:hypothetical protein VIBNISFn27_110009 [Vibrio nigripulchritudo SFn27]|uniref:Apea-like HEPN domain-containing protein n=1 Tax=Vibrio nigripulchritudo TaxID=28173 RepID=U4K5C9_9VIBR|nr:hypothetical protein [Vibrio nigripulchritudo]CCN81248.1 hypothetical protein VIBNIBLFn1_200009 [Vibrio nigripulchritudo BLFn1]CCN86571.1 hypothetical protein VIBNISFn27_110009 [Vibrio nigripulchritudo SFn27]CCN97182.1 hypothetical protein VIBNIENn2_890098 [Vibrio nigripulchritudo ENn2]CCO42985.1 hypothetical protein VIBNISFn135_910011 [Vibrio nigripulchritudo SFn135]CCO50621.1 hypothetical protein VIBNIWn13_1020011 [Vibrio nigripulchritudo Wn13]